jgi:5-methylcytosine-specific restriction endonuclease McrA
MKKLFALGCLYFLVLSTLVAFAGAQRGSRSHSTRSKSASNSSTTSGRVHVRSYTKKDGTVVGAHTRSAPSRSHSGATASSQTHRSSPRTGATTSTARTYDPPKSTTTTPRTYGSSRSTTSTPRTYSSSTSTTATARSSSGTQRNPNVRAAFRRTHPCPPTGRTTGACPGYEVDHIVPLYRGGSDATSNMHWLSTSEHKAKHQTK